MKNPEIWISGVAAIAAILSSIWALLAWFRSGKAEKIAEEALAETKRQFSLTNRPKVIAEIQPQKVARSSGLPFTAFCLILKNDGAGDAHRIDAKLITGSTSRPHIHYTLDTLQAGKDYTPPEIPRFEKGLAVQGTITFFGIDGTAWESIRREGDTFWDTQRAEKPT